MFDERMRGEFNVAQSQRQRRRTLGSKLPLDTGNSPAARVYAHFFLAGLKVAKRPKRGARLRLEYLSLKPLPSNIHIAWL